MGRNFDLLGIDPEVIAEVDKRKQQRKLLKGGSSMEVVNILNEYGFGRKQLANKIGVSDSYVSQLVIGDQSARSRMSDLLKYLHSSRKLIEKLDPHSPNTIVILRNRLGISTRFLARKMGISNARLAWLCSNSPTLPPHLGEKLESFLTELKYKIEGLV